MAANVGNEATEHDIARLARRDRNKLLTGGKVVSLRTGRRVRNLAIDLEPERIVLRGQAATYHVKQLAQHGILERLPHLRLENIIVVTSAE